MHDDDETTEGLLAQYQGGEPIMMHRGSFPQVRISGNTVIPAPYDTP
jgi:hypothetical protein